jgi:hypothetical protein
MTHLILASTSQVRKKILTDSALDFEVIAPLYDEDNEKKNLPKMSAKKLALFLAKEKALSISAKFPKAYVIGSDQVCEFQKKEISKSKNAQEALAQLKKFNGKIHFQNNVPHTPSPFIFRAATCGWRHCEPRRHGLLRRLPRGPQRDVPRGQGGRRRPPPCQVRVRVPRCGGGAMSSSRTRSSTEPL